MFYFVFYLMFLFFNIFYIKIVYIKIKIQENLRKFINYNCRNKK